MKQLLTTLFIVISLSSFAQGNAVKDTAAIRKQQEEFSKFAVELVGKATIKDFQEWVYENFPAKKNDEFLQMYYAFIQQKYVATKSKNK